MAVDETTEVAVTLTIEEWRMVTAATRMASTVSGDRPEIAAYADRYRTISANVWEQGVDKPTRTRLRSAGWAAKKEVRFVPSEGPSE